MGRRKKIKNSEEFEAQHKLNKLKQHIQSKAQQLKGETPTGSDLFRYGIPVSPKDFIESKDFYGNSVTNEIYPWIIDTMEEIFSGEYYAPKYETVICLCGIGSGKGTLAAVSTAYMWYWLLSFKSLRTYFATKNITWADNDTISFINMAPRANQAKEIVFDRVTKFINRVKFFRDHAWLPDPNVSSELIYRENDPLSQRPFDKLRVVPGNSSKTFTLGYSIFGGVIDEACFFREKTKDPCKDIYNELDGRRVSRFKNLGVTMLISSANTDGDFVQQLVRDTADDPKVLFQRKSTYDCKPEYFDVPKFELKIKQEKADGELIDVTLTPPESLKYLYERNQNKTLRDWDALPSVAGNPFFSDWALLSSKINKDRKDPCPDEGMDKPETPGDIQTKLPSDFVGKPGVSYRIHIDLAKGDIVKGHCGAGFAMTHKRIDGNLGFKITLDLAVRFKVKSGQEVSVNEILDLILYLHNEKRFKIDVVTFDQWNSMFPIQTINAWKNGIHAEELRVGYKQFTYLKNLMYAGQADFYYDQNLMFELKRLEDYQTSIEPAPGSMKDEADAVAGAFFSAGSLKKSQQEMKPRAVRGAMTPRTANSAGGIPKPPGSVYKAGINEIPRYRQ